MKLLATTCVCCKTFSFSHAVGLCNGESNPIQCSATVWRLGNSCHVVGISVWKYRTQITLTDCPLLLQSDLASSREICDLLRHVRGVLEESSAYFSIPLCNV